MLMQVIIIVIMITIFQLLLNKTKIDFRTLLQETGALPECLFKARALLMPKLKYFFWNKL